MSVFEIQEVQIQYIRPVLTCLKRITTFDEAIHVLRDYADERRIDYKEFMWVILLNRANYLLGIAEIGAGTTHGVMVNIREIFQLALCSNASGVILAHNHPSGNLTPSNADKKITSKVEEFGKLIDIDLLDHVILTSEGATSIRYEEKENYNRKDK